MSAVNPRVNINPQDFLELESIETNGDESPFPEENDDDDDKDTEDHPKDDATVKDGEQPKTDGTTEPATETPKRARSEDAAEDMAAKLGMTNAQLNKAKQLVEKAANQGLSFHDGTTIELSDKTQLWKTTEQKFKFTQPGGDTSTMFAAIGIFVYDAAKGYEGNPRLPIGANAVNFGNVAANKRRSTFVLQGCGVVDPMGHFDPDKVLRRIQELETIGHKASIKTATALVQTFQDRLRTSPTEPGYANKWAKYALFQFPSWKPTVHHDGHVVVKCSNKVYTNMQPGENDANYMFYPTFFGANPLFQAAHATAKVVDPTPWATIEEDGTIKELNITNTDGFTTHLLQPGDKCVFIIEPTHKSGERYSALELSINYIYKLPFPPERIDLNIVSASSSASSTPVKSPMPTQPTERPAKVTKINFD